MQKLTFEKIARPALAAIMILAFWATYPHSDAATEPYTGPITVRYYEHPQAEQDALRACAETEREARGIPGERNAYLAWWNENEGTAAEQSWSSAYQSCKDAHLWKQGKWNWTSRVLVKEEVHNG